MKRTGCNTYAEVVSEIRDGAVAVAIWGSCSFQKHPKSAYVLRADGKRVSVAHQFLYDAVKRGDACVKEDGDGDDWFAADQDRADDAARHRRFPAATTAPKGQGEKK